MIGRLMDGCWELIFLPAIARRRLNSAGADYRATKARIRLPPENNRVSEESHSGEPVNPFDGAVAWARLVK
jgi:hypothetical protein